MIPSLTKSSLHSNIIISIRHNFDSCVLKSYLSTFIMDFYEYVYRKTLKVIQNTRLSLSFLLELLVLARFNPPCFVVPATTASVLP
jgi:hypothetical protein